MPTVLAKGFKVHSVGTRNGDARRSSNNNRTSTTYIQPPKGFVILFLEIPSDIRMLDKKAETESKPGIKNQGPREDPEFEFDVTLVFC